VSKERARRREAREAEAATRRAEHERRTRRDARRRARRNAVRKRLAPLTTGRQTGVLAQRRRARLNVILAFLLLVQVVVWVVRPDWQARLTALLVAALAFPVLAAFTL
jgi:Flp pilus assembly protein TadB